MDDNGRRTGWFGVKAVAVVVVGALGLGAMFYGSSIGTETSKKSSLPATESQSQKPVRAMNLALGPMVFLARELDFTVKNAKGEKLDDSRIARACRDPTTRVARSISPRDRQESQASGQLDLAIQRQSSRPSQPGQGNKLAGSTTLNSNKPSPPKPASGPSPSWSANP